MRFANLSHKSKVSNEAKFSRKGIGLEGKRHTQKEKGAQKEAEKDTQKIKRNGNLSNVGDVPQIEAAIAIDAGHLVVGLVISKSYRIRIFGIGWMRGHVTDRKTFGNIDTKIVCPR